MGQANASKDSLGSSETYCHKAKLGPPVEIGREIREDMGSRYCKFKFYLVIEVLFGC